MARPVAATARTTRPRGPAFQHQPRAPLALAPQLRLRMLLQRPQPQRPCQAGRSLQARRRLRRRWLEAMLTALATTFLTSLALAHPAVLRDSPSTTWQRAFAPAVDGTILVDCP